LTVLSVDCVGKDYGTRQVLTAASLNLNAGRIEALVGRNGAGKSTLMGIAAGLITAKHGLVIWKGERLKRARLWQLARRGLMFLPADGLLAPAGRVRDQLSMFAETFPGGMPAEEAVRHMRLEECGSRRIVELSGGERRRADIAAALVRRPACLIADELFRDVAPLDCEFIGSILRELAERGVAIAISGHELAFVMRYSDHVTWCTNGTTRALGSPQMASDNDSFRSEFLGQQWNSIGSGPMDTNFIFPNI
jgi:ABC-type multidrug transport system ATPase subunit